MEHRPRVAVIGGGVSGLTAAYRLVRDGADVTVVESSARLGGKLHASPVAGVSVDAGAESVLLRRPEALDLMTELGLGDQLVYPAPAPARIHSRGKLRPFPTGHVMGVPGEVATLARSGVLSWTGVLRVAAEPFLPRSPVGGDVSVSAYIGGRMGREVVDRLVEPLLGGVYAGRAEQLSLEATLPQIAELAGGERSLLRAVRALKEQQAIQSVPGPAFATLRGGMATLVDALAKHSGADLWTSSPVRQLRANTADNSSAGSATGTTSSAGSWTLTVGTAEESHRIPVDSVVLACPAPEAARLLAPVSSVAAGELDGIEYASMAIVTLAYPAAAFHQPPTGSGFLVGARENRNIKAATFSSVKWPWLAEELHVLHPGSDIVLIRCSMGRKGEEILARHSDMELADFAASDLAGMCGISGTPLERRVTRWDGGLPQYAVGHEGRIARARAALAQHPSLALCGAAYDGVGIPACVASGNAAARALSHQADQM